MKHIKMAVVLMLATTLAAMQVVHAQTINEFRKMPAEQKAHLLVDSLKVMLSLTDGQYNKAYTIVFDGVTKAAPIVKSDDTRFAKGQKLKALLAGEEEKMKQLLSQAQFDVFQTKKQQAIAYYRQHFGEERLVFNVSAAE